MKKILTASLVAIMAVTAARAEIASTDYVTTRTGDVSFADAQIAKNAQNLTEAVKALDTKLGTVAGSGAGSVSDQIDGKINALNGSVAEDGKVVLTVKQENGAVTGTTGKITDAVVDSISIGKVSGLQDALNEKQIVGNMIQNAKVQDATTKEDDTKYLSAKATYSMIDNELKQVSDGLSVSVGELEDRVGGTESDIGTLMGGTDVTGSIAAQINSAKTEINQTIQNMNNASAEGSVANKIQTVETNLGTVTSANMGTDATTVVGAIKEVVTEAAAAQTAANKAQGEVDVLESVVSQQNTTLTSAIETAKTDAAADAKAKADKALEDAKAYADQAEADAITAAGTAADAKIAALDVADTAVAGEYVSAVSEADGKISVTRASLSPVAKMNVPEACENGTATCALVYDNVTKGLKWESIME